MFCCCIFYIVFLISSRFGDLYVSLYCTESKCLAWTFIKEMTKVMSYSDKGMNLLSFQMSLVALNLRKKCVFARYQKKCQALSCSCGLSMLNTSVYILSNPSLIMSLFTHTMRFSGIWQHHCRLCVQYLCVCLYCTTPLNSMYINRRFIK